MSEDRRTAGSGAPFRILVVSDKVIPRFLGPQLNKYIKPVDLLLSCGDLPYSYLEYLVTMLQVPYAFFVHGNHDSPEKLKNGKVLYAPGGWKNVDRRVGKLPDGRLLIAGLEGSILYRPGAPYQYTQEQMSRRAYLLILSLLWNRVRYGRYLDIFIAHSPASGIHDRVEGAHQGFRVFLTLIQNFKPRLFLHGHQHHYGMNSWHTKYQETEIINIYPYKIIEFYADRISYKRGCYF